MKTGDMATWLYTPRGGYGYTIPVDAEVVAVYPSRVRIRVRRRDGALVERSVTPERLRAASIAQVAIAKARGEAGQ